MINPRPSDPPPLIEVLAVWGWAVQHGGIPLAYAAAVVADHPVYTDHSGVPDPTEDERLTWAADDLRTWEDVVGPPSPRGRRLRATPFPAHRSGPLWPTPQMSRHQAR